jgi:hypothetical protein
LIGVTRDCRENREKKLTSLNEVKVRRSDATKKATYFESPMSKEQRVSCEMGSYILTTGSPKKKHD